MLKDKRGLFGKIFLILGIILGLIIAFIGITAWQVYSFVTLIKTEQTNIQTSMKNLQTGDCTKVTEIEQSIKNIETSAKGMCKNPLIKSVTEKMDQLPVKCSTINQIQELTSSGLAGIKTACENKTATNATTKTCKNTNEMCGGISGNLCCTGLTCKYDGNYADASGICVTA